MKVLIHFAKWCVGLAPAETQTTIDERDCLVRYAAGRTQLAEIGVWHGVTTCRLRQSMCPDGTLYAIDPYPAGRLGVSFQQIIAHSQVSSIANARVVWLRNTGVAAAAAFAAEARLFDFLFIDGDHTWDGLEGDWNAWKPLIAKGGIVALHDSRSTPHRPLEDAGSARFTRQVILNDPGFRVLDEVDSLTVLERCE